METGKALELLKQFMGELEHLRTLHYENDEQWLWKNKVNVVLEAAFGKDSDEYKEWNTIYPIAVLLSEEGQQRQYFDDLRHYERRIKMILQRYEMLGIETTSEEPKDTVKSPLDIFDAMQFHPKIVNASSSLFKDGYYAQAIFEAFKAVNNFVKEKSGSSLDGKTLMSTVFSEEKPIIKINDLLNSSDRDEQEGFKFLFMGAMVGIRNPKAHDNVIQTDPYRTLEYLAFASLLMKRVEAGKVVRLKKEEQI